MRSDLIDIDVDLIHETDRAVLVSVGGAKAVWVPKSACEIEREGKGWKLTLREALAVDKGLV
jgi:hypothetical protein